MNTKGRALAGALMLVCAASATAQVAIAPASQAVILAPATANVVRAGTPVALKMSEGLTTEKKKLRVGHRFQLETTEAVSVNGVTVIPVGSPVTAEVTQIRNKGMWGKSGYIGAQVLFVRANGRQIRMTGTFDDKGVTGTGAVVGALVVAPILGFVMTGTSARIPAGSAVKAFIDEDVTFAVAEPAPTVVTAPAAAPAVAPTAPAAPVLTPAVATTPGTR
jgi:hypothetical protein